MPVTIRKQPQYKAGWNSMQVHRASLDEFLNELQSWLVDMHQVKVTADHAPDHYMVMFRWGM